MTIDELKESWDWQHIFEIYTSPDPCEGDTAVSTESFGLDDVQEIIAAEDGENDGDTWIGVFRLKDRRYAFVTVGCDYTGWGCQESGGSTVSLELNRLILFGIGDEDRHRLNLGR